MSEAGTSPVPSSHDAPSPSYHPHIDVLAAKGHKNLPPEFFEALKTRPEIQGLSASQIETAISDAVTFANNKGSLQANGTHSLDFARAAKAGKAEVTIQDFVTALKNREVGVTRVAEAGVRPEVMARLREQAAAPSPTPRTHPTMKTEGETFVEHVSHDHMVGEGMTWLTAALCAVGTWSTGRNMVTKDDQGKTRWNATAVGLTLVQGLLTAGMIYTGVQMSRSRG